jgi:multiple sugar transport system ATP-binding protein
MQRRLGITTVYVTHDQTEAMTLGDRVAVLKRGILQQLATPRELYTNPVNLFVAGFIGSPPMNFLPATVEGNQVKMPFGTVTIPEANARRATGKGLLIAGIRPEHFEDATVMDSSKTSGSTFKTKVDVVEWLGNQAYAYSPFEAPEEVQQQLLQLERDLDGEALVTQLVISLDGASRIKEGDEATIWVDADKIHLFDPSTGENLTVDASAAGTIPQDTSTQEVAHRQDSIATPGEQEATAKE